METAITTQETIEVKPVTIDLVRWQGYSIEAERIADAVIISDDSENEMALSAVKKIKTFYREVEEARKESVSPFNDYVKRINDMFRPIADSLAKAEFIIKQKMLAFNNEKERIRREEQERLRKQHEEEVRRAQQEAKAKNIEPVIPLPPPILMEENSVKTDGASASFVSVWKAQVTDLKTLLAGVVAGTVPIDAVIPNESFLNKQAKAYKKDGVYAGVKFYEEKQPRIR